jgi:acetoin utilization protein AcuB
MIANDLISSELQPLFIHMDSETALQQIQAHGVNHLPVCSPEGHYLGLLSEEEIIRQPAESPIESYAYTLEPYACHHSDHLFDVMKKISEADVSVLPVLNHDNRYLGCIVRNELYEYYSTRFAWSEPGSILVIHVHGEQYSLSEISHIIEAENAMVLSSIASKPVDGQIILTLKINRIDISRIIAALRRYDYDVSATYSEEEVTDNFKERFDAFMRYLDV